jgi:hypothetical protein
MVKTAFVRSVKPERAEIAALHRRAHEVEDRGDEG